MTYVHGLLAAASNGRARQKIIAIAERFITEPISHGAIGCPLGQMKAHREREREEKGQGTCLDEDRPHRIGSAHHHHLSPEKWSSPSANVM
ncbi:hypothetical protein [Streptosporangium sp. H16]|uniref:hypothetical protein n=1 Tax=Streptosporangium sp. H16 TaxID=3444184 RepID=UPI003F7A50C0